ncbi:DoxX family protein [Acinetobacter zhairhuonensis]|uniref:DoxX family protein n=1 Tax=Acinetobacter sp. A7.4 TaxID=2919921 RepID=UPI001F4F8CFE|nr:DoxX family protein [Acinetobacter sp. A7.4]MCJ8161255.1 DoxX family protein [Acinetobacter sp. A7.4]
MIEILSSTLFLIVAKIILTFFFWIAGIYGIVNFQEIEKEMKDVQLPYPRFFAVATIFCQLMGSLLIILNPYGFGWIGAGALIIFTLLTIPLGHAFWKFDEPQRTSEFHIALEHISLIGGLMIAAALSVM